MKIGILGSGPVGQALAKGCISEGHEVFLATREPEGDKAAQLKTDVSGATVCDYATAASEAELAFFCANWKAAEEAIGLIGPDNLSGKIVIDTSNTMEQGPNGMALVSGIDGSAGEQVQSWLPNSHVVKAFNTVGAVNMYKPSFTTTPTMFIAGNDSDAKKQVTDIVTMFGWETLDAGDITAARALEPMAIVWVNFVMGSGDPHHAYKML